MSKPEVVVLVHGIWMTGFELSLLRYRLHRCGYRTRLFHYASLRRTPAQNAEYLNRFLEKIKADKIHLLAHSLGGIVLMHLFQHFPAQRPGRVLMLATPAQGSALARRFQIKSWLRPLLGQSTEKGLLGDAPAWRDKRELGLIVGDRPVGLLALLTGAAVQKPSDGTVSVAETKIDQASDVLRLPVSHFSMLADWRVAAAACLFLRNGKFLCSATVSCPSRLE